MCQRFGEVLKNGQRQRARGSTPAPYSPHAADASLNARSPGGALFDGDDSAALVDVDQPYVEPAALLQELQVAGALGLDVREPEQEEAVADFDGERQQRRCACLSNRELLRLARKRNLETRAATKQPGGQITQTLSSHFDKNIPLNPSGKSSL
jgi:hypothetical protein